LISEVLRHFESGDIVLVRLDSQCLPAIVFNVSGLVMKFDSKIKRNEWNLLSSTILFLVDRQLYHVCLLDKEFTEQWIDATDMVIYSVPV
jgi:hypothetical protein